MATLIVTVNDKATQRPIPWVSVEINGASASTNTNGQVTFNVNAGAAMLKVRTTAYQPYTKTITIPAGGAKVTIGLFRALL